MIQTTFEFLPPVRRPYDPKLGDRRFHSLTAALRVAHERATSRGVRQRVRLSTGPCFTVLYLVQDH